MLTKPTNRASLRATHYTAATGGAIGDATPARSPLLRNHRLLNTTALLLLRRCAH